MTGPVSAGIAAAGLPQALERWRLRVEHELDRWLPAANVVPASAEVCRKRRRERMTLRAVIVASAV